MRIMVAEDNQTNQRVVKLLLERMGCVVRVVENGEEVLTAANEGEFDVILMDCQMPVMDGLEASRFLAKPVEKAALLEALTRDWTKAAIS